MGMDRREKSRTSFAGRGGTAVQGGEVSAPPGAGGAAPDAHLSVIGDRGKQVRAFNWSLGLRNADAGGAAGAARRCAAAALCRAARPPLPRTRAARCVASLTVPGQALQRRVKQVLALFACKALAAHRSGPVPGAAKPAGRRHSLLMARQTHDEAAYHRLQSMGVATGTRR